MLIEVFRSKLNDEFIIEATGLDVKIFFTQMVLGAFVSERFVRNPEEILKRVQLDSLQKKISLKEDP